MALILVSFLFVMGNLLFQPILTLYMRDVGASILDVGLMLAVSSVIGTATRIPAGLASNRYGRKALIVFALVTQPVSIVLLYLVQDPRWFYPVLAFRAVPFAAYWSSATALASDMAPEGRRGEVLGRYLTSFGLAMFAGPLLCSVLTDVLSYRSILLVNLAFPLVSATLFLASGLAPDQATSPVRAGDGGAVWDAVKRILASRTVQALMVIAILISITTSAFAALFSIYAKETLLFSPSLISFLFTARGGANALIRAPTGRVSDRIHSRRTPLIVAYALQALAYLAISLTGSFSLLLAGMASFGFGWGMRAVLSNTFFIENVEVRDRDLALSIYISMFGVGQFLGSILAGALSASVSTPGILQLSAVLLGLAIVLMTRITTEHA
jgi:predicted MFS family arabinose efflux permease